MKVSMPLPKVVLLEFPTRKELTMTMCRVQEYYESPHANIKKKIFTMEEFFDTHMDDSGYISYFEQWSGFNLPGHVIDQFFARFKDITPREKKMMEAICLYVKPPEKYYVISTEKDDPETVKHEYAHALWIMDSVYQNKAQLIVGEIPVKHHRNLMKQLLGMGYDKSVVDDEINAYLSTSSRAELDHNFHIEDYDELKPYIKQLRKLFKNTLDKHFEDAEKMHAAYRKQMKSFKKTSKALEKAYKRGDEWVANGGDFKKLPRTKPDDDGYY